MIGRLRGKLLEKSPPYLLIDVSGVGYEVEAPMTTFFQLPELGQELTLYTHFHVREDAQSLFGFHRQDDRTLFRALIRVNGVGAKVALGILSGMSGADLIRCIREDNIAALVRLPGIGKKTAERLIIEMRDRIKDLECIPQSGEASKRFASGGGSLLESQSNEVEDAISALIALGYKASEAQNLVNSVKQENFTSEKLIRLALQASVKG
ncbi:MAG: Holliday junction branch migration protein RuvA [Gammaproteobacteria bacterium]|nr:Holliday junction branch migration protein RuvA [Gammaproteobacteria bacterium]MDH5692183.1 Holliday junction branch migration protein RuvA [Gammaproteobacteria bacterium]